MLRQSVSLEREGAGVHVVIYLHAELQAADD